MTMRSLPLATALLIALSATDHGVAQQQAASARQPTRVPVTLVLVDDLPRSEVPFLVERRPGVAPHDVILLRSDATPEQLSEAIRTLLVIRQVEGDTTSRRATMRTRLRQAHAGPRREFPWVSRVLADLRRAPPEPLAGYGEVRAVEIWLPPQRGRAPQ